jgi:hypothetical protein
VSVSGGGDVEIVAGGFITEMLGGGALYKEEEVEEEVDALFIFSTNARLLNFFKMDPRRAIRGEDDLCNSPSICCPSARWEEREEDEGRSSQDLEIGEAEEDVDEDDVEEDEDSGFSRE